MNPQSATTSQINYTIDKNRVRKLQLKEDQDHNYDKTIYDIKCSRNCIYREMLLI